jgi:hypothetical protein
MNCFIFQEGFQVLSKRRQYLGAIAYPSNFSVRLTPPQKLRVPVTSTITVHFGTR